MKTVAAPTIESPSDSNSQFPIKWGRVSPKFGAPIDGKYRFCTLRYYKMPDKKDD